MDSQVVYFSAAYSMCIKYIFFMDIKLDDFVSVIRITWYQKLSRDFQRGMISKTLTSYITVS